VKRATIIVLRLCFSTKISIHALVKRATIYQLQQIIVITIFQSTPS